MLFLSLLNKHLLLCANKPSSNVEESESFSSSSSSHHSTSPSPFRRFLCRLGSLIMPCSPSSPCSLIRSWLRDYDRIQAVAVVLIYIQIGCALIGSLGALFNGVLLINLVVALFALVAIESSSQSLGRAYAVLLFCSVMLDIAWFILFSHTIWEYDPEKYGQFFVFSIRVAFLMQIVGFTIRLLSSFLWIQIYRLGVSCVNSTTSREADFDVRNSFFNPPIQEITIENSNADDIIGGSIYDPAYYSSLFQATQDKGCVHEGDNQIIGRNSGLASVAETSQLQLGHSRSYQVIDKKLQIESNGA
uniref:Uncharacterized protein LOC105044928 isoform X2 n=1 Tax=Elaeis guineensis var. tenera TaxID=51953 RepID=A0A8N4IFX4_ELAGV|nr:uncharacterized protein LOC105044928 isoform X2 [Elaeis guineensis]